MAQVTNLSPNQIRTNLRRFVADQTAAQQKAAAAPEGTVPVSQNLPPAPGDGGMSFTPRSFTPNAPASTTTNTTEGGAPGTAVTPYIMGTNRTTVDPTPADDFWTLASGPNPAGGGPYDGAFINFTSGFMRQVNNGTSYSGQADKAGGGVINIFQQPVLFFGREVKVDSLGAVVYIGPEYQIGGVGPYFS